MSNKKRFKQTGKKGGYGGCLLIPAIMVIILILITGGAFSQTYNLPVSNGQKVYIRRNNTNVITLPTAQSDDSVYNFILTRIKKSFIPPPPNQLPVARAGNDISLVLPANTCTLNGTGSTDADGTIVSYNWSLVSGVTYSMINQNASIATLLDLVAGNYTFRLMITDNNGAVASDDVNVFVLNTPPPPDTTGNKNIEGFGAGVTGGTGLQVVHVTNLNASGAGSLLAAMGSNRTIVFDVGGTISGFRFDGGNGFANNIVNLTIDGSTAPSPGITLDNKNNGNCLGFEGTGNSNIIIKYIRTINAGNDGLHFANGVSRFVLDHCSSYGNRDGNIDITSGAHDGTVQYCFIGGGADNSASYSGSMLLGYSPQNISVHHNLISPVTIGGVGERCPNVSDPGRTSLPNFLMADIRNNLIWKWGRNNGQGSGYGTSCAYFATENCVNNYYYSIQSPTSATNMDDGYGGGAGSSKGYFAGNVSGNTGYNPNAISNHVEFTIPVANQVTMQTPCAAARLIITSVGLPVKTSYELDRIININLPGCPAL